MSKYQRLTGYITITTPATQHFRIQRTDIGGQPTRNITLTNGDLFPSGDGSADDLIDDIEDKVIAYAELDKFRAYIGTGTGSWSGGTWASDPAVANGRCMFRFTDAAHTATITWDDTDLRDWLRYTGATSSMLADTHLIGERQIAFVFHPDLAILSDDEISIARVSQSRTSSGIVDTVSYTSWTDHRMGVQFNGPVRESSAQEYHEMRDFIVTHARHGKRFRTYTDRDGQKGSYTEFTTPDGYQLWVLRGDSSNWDQPPIYGNWYQWFSKDMRLQEYTT